MTSSKMRSAPLPRARRAQAFQKAGIGRHDAHVARDGLHDDAGHLALVRVDEPLDGDKVVVGRDERVARGPRRDAGRAGDAEGGHAAAGAGQKRVAVAVVAALELDDEAAPREPAREAHGAHDGLGARRHHARLLGAGHKLAYARSARRTSASHGAPNESPRSSWARTASSTAAGRCPRIMGPHEPMKSTYSLPSTSVTRLPAARS